MIPPPSSNLLSFLVRFARARLTSNIVVMAPSVSMTMIGRLIRGEIRGNSRCIVNVRVPTCMTRSLIKSDVTHELLGSEDDRLWSPRVSRACRIRARMRVIDGSKRNR